jgi:hypothetical protein
VKPAYLKKALRVSWYTSSWLVCPHKRKSADKDLQYKLLQPSSNTANKLIIQRQMKENELWFWFYSTEAVINRERTKFNYNLRHFVTRMAVHGFNHKICQTKGYHSPNKNCQCKLSDSECRRYHITDCKGRTTLLSSYAEEN